MNLKRLVIKKNDKFTLRVLKYTKTLVIFGFLIIEKFLLYHLLLSLWLRLYIKKGFFLKNLNWFLICFSMLKQQLKVNFFKILQIFFFQYSLNIITATVKKSGKLYVVPWPLYLAKIYKYFFKMLKSQIDLRTESTLILKFVGECNSFYLSNGQPNSFFLLRQNICKVIFENKHQAYLMRKY